MKRCPQCNSLYEDSVQFCLNDGQPLVDESFSLPSDEEETIIRHDPITINVPAPEPAAANYYAPPVEKVLVVPADSATANRSYALFLIIGLLIGGGLVLATLLLARNYFQTAKTNSINAAANSNQTANVKTPKSTPDAVNTNTAAVEKPSGKHDEPNPDANDGLFNGRVIASNARVRSEPNSNASVVDVLPFGDRLDIIDRAGANSPWYQVECEHGTTGWMHGDAIEFTKGNF
ncbi:MAG: SH3 domain-containing protein [Pyrinomonadaceae bacterium]